MTYSTLVFLGVISPLTMIISGIAGFGDGIAIWLVMYSLQAICSPETLSQIFLSVDGFDPTDPVIFYRFNVIFLSFRALFMCTLFVFLLRKEIAQTKNWARELLVFVAPPAACGTLLGCWILDNHGASVWLRPAVGILIGTFASILLVFRLVKDKETRDAEDEIVNSPVYDTQLDNDVEYNQRYRRYFFLAAFVSGILGAVCTIASPPPTVVSILMKAPKARSRKNLTLLFFSIFVTRFLWTTRLLGILDLVFPTKEGEVAEQSPPMFFDTAYREAAVFVIGGGVGLIIGNAVASKLSNARYLLVVISMLFVIGILLSSFVPPLVVAFGVCPALVAWILMTTD